METDGAKPSILRLAPIRKLPARTLRAKLEEPSRSQAGNIRTFRTPYTILPFLLGPDASLNVSGVRKIPHTEHCDTI